MNANQTNWPRYLPIIAHAYRTTVNSATGYSPFRALYGREARTPSDSWIQDFSTTHDIPIDKYVEELQFILTVVWDDIAKTNLTKETLADHREAQDALSEHHLPYHGFDVDDMVYIKQTPQIFHIADDNEKFKLTAKLQHRYHGPHPVVAIINPVSFDVNINGKIKRVHANKMKRATPHARHRKAYVPLIDDTLLTDDPNDVVIPEEEIALLPSDPAPLAIIPEIPDKPPEIAVATDPSAMNRLFRPDNRNLNAFLQRDPPLQPPTAQDTGT